VRRIKSPLLAAALASFVSTAAGATDQPPFGADGPNQISYGTGFYFGLRGGINAMQDTTFNSGTTTTGPTRITIAGIPDPINPTTWLVPPYIFDRTVTTTAQMVSAYRPGLHGSAMFGWDFGEFYPGFAARIEGEAGWFRNEVARQTLVGSARTTDRPVSVAGPDTVTDTNGIVSTETRPGARGSATVVYGLANYYVDLVWGRFRPFVGLGIGLAMVNFDNYGTGGAIHLAADSLGWAWQGGGGLAYEVNRNLTLEASYRFLGIRDLGVTSTAGIRNNIDIRNQQVNLGARVRF